MTIHLLYKNERQPSTRIRLVEMAPHLTKLGLECRVAAYPRTATERRELSARLASGDRVVVHRTLPRSSEMRFWRQLPVPLIFDFDDAVMVRKKPLLGIDHSPGRRRAFDRMLSACDAVMCGNAFLASTCKKAGIPVLIAPSAVPVDVPRMEDCARGPVPKIGWIGLASNLRYVRMIAPALRRLAAERRFVLTLISDASLELEGCEVEWRRWSVGDQEKMIAELDVGIMPLRLNNDWSRGKCAFKVLQYMAAGVPAVASDVGMNSDLIRSGRNGLLASSPEDWRQALHRLLDDAELRLRLGREGRRTVETSYSYPRIAERIAQFLSELGPKRRG